MQEFNLIDRSGWGEGPWDGEPDYLEKDLEGGWKYCIIRQPRGHLCGYVIVPEGHRLRGLSWESLSSIEVHWGLTFSGPMRRYPDVWAFGFDCAHCEDMTPSDKRFWDTTGTYRDVAFAEKECESLLSQLKTFTFPDDIAEAYARLGYMDAEEAFRKGAEWAREQ